MKSRLWLPILGILMLVMFAMGCELIDDGSLTVEEIRSISTEWTDENDSQLSFVGDDASGYKIDIAWYTDPSDTNRRVMGFLEEDAYTVDGSALEGVYTSFENEDSTEEFAITIEFSYADEVLSAVIDADGVLGNKTLELVAVDY
jgi:hypothetical protein